MYLLLGKLNLVLFGPAFKVELYFAEFSLTADTAQRGFIEGVSMKSFAVMKLIVRTALTLACVGTLSSFAMQVRADSLYVADNDPLAPTISILGANFSPQGAFSVPGVVTGLAAGPAGQIYVADATH